MIPYGRQNLTEQDVQAVADVLRSDRITQGNAVPAFESDLAKCCQARFAVAVNSGTSALHLACLALGLGPGDRLWTSPITFVASANCALYCGASVDFVDVEPDTANMDMEALASKLEKARDNGCLPKIVVPVHFAGQPCDMSRLNELAAEYGFSILEDASHALGADYEGAPVGSCRYSHATVFSFHPVKMITTGEGGAVVTNSKKLADEVAQLRSHGISRNRDTFINEPDGPWYYEQQMLGFNYRMTDMQAALGLSQLPRLGHFVAERQRLAACYDQAFEDEGRLRGLAQRASRQSSYHLYMALVPPGKRLSTFKALQEGGFGVNVHYIPVPWQPYYRQLGFAPGMFPAADRYYSEAITLPLFVGYEERYLQQVVEIIHTNLK